VGTGLGLGPLIAGVAAGFAGGYWSVWYTDNPIGWGLWCFVIGYIMCDITMAVLKSCVVTLYVCLAEDPAVLARTRATEYAAVKAAARTTYEDAADGILL
jgi:hypothetical protein